MGEIVLIILRLSAGYYYSLSGFGVGAGGIVSVLVYTAGFGVFAMNEVHLKWVDSRQERFSRKYRKYVQFVDCFLLH